jgi:rhodanese-related sulfurtransferase
MRGFPFSGGCLVKFFTDYINLILIAIAVVSGALLALPVLMRRGRGISSQDAIQLINRRNAVVLDIRDAAAFATGHLPQARHLAFADLAKAPQVAKNKSTPVLLVCQTGQRSTKAEATLKEAGYAEVYVLDGGLDAWSKAGMPVVKQGVAK